jgi:hypothetical protein
MSHFKHAAQKSKVSKLNSAPGGEGGVDQETQKTLGAVGFVGDIKDKKHGICCGISATWIVGFVNGVEEARDTAKFKDYFNNVLRFQGAYIKESHEDIEKDLDKMQDCFAHDVKKVDFQYSRATTLKDKFPNKDRWAAYLSIFGHAVAIGRYANQYYAMDPNHGLFVYNDVDTIAGDVKEFVHYRRDKKNEDKNSQFKVWFYEKK